MPRFDLLLTNTWWYFPAIIINVIQTPPLPESNPSFSTTRREMIYSRGFLYCWRCCVTVCSRNYAIGVILILLVFHQEFVWILFLIFGGTFERPRLLDFTNVREDPDGRHKILKFEIFFIGFPIFHAKYIFLNKRTLRKLLCNWKCVQ